MQVDLIAPIADVVVAINAPNSTINLLEQFDDPFTTGQVAIFQLANGDDFTNGGQIELLLFDQEGVGAPIAVENFSTLVNDGAFTNLVVNRGEADFLIQAGQFTLDPETLAIEFVTPVLTFPGEASPERSNLPGTISFAASDADPDTAVSQSFFFNVSDNSFLDDDNFTSFGQVLTDADFEVVEAISNDPVFEPFQGPLTPPFDGGGFLPVAIEDGAFVTPLEFPGVDLAEVVSFSEISLESRDELTFVATSSNPDLVSPIVDGDTLTLDFASDLAGTAEVTVAATNLLGDTNSTTFSVEVTGTLPDPGDLDLNLDNVGGFDPFVDALNLFRVAAGAPQAVVVTADAAAAGVTQQSIVDAATALEDSTALNVDTVGGFDPFVDALNIFRVAAGAPQAVVVTADAAAVGVTQQSIVDAVELLLG